MFRAKSNGDFTMTARASSAPMRSANGSICPPIASVALVQTTLVPHPNRCWRSAGATSIGALRSATIDWRRPVRSAQ
jgi:hypothetical protein